MTRTCVRSNLRISNWYMMQLCFSIILYRHIPLQDETSLARYMAIYGGIWRYMNFLFRSTYGWIWQYMTGFRLNMRLSYWYMMQLSSPWEERACKSLTAQGMAGEGAIGRMHRGCWWGAEWMGSGPTLPEGVWKAWGRWISHYIHNEYPLFGSARRLHIEQHQHCLHVNSTAKPTAVLGRTRWVRLPTAAHSTHTATAKVLCTDPKSRTYPTSRDVPEGATFVVCCTNLNRTYLGFTYFSQELLNIYTRFLYEIYESLCVWLALT
jgi:hypothetical protein